MCDSFNATISFENVSIANSFINSLLHKNITTLTFRTVDELQGRRIWAEFPTDFGKMLVSLKGEALVHLGFYNDTASSELLWVCDGEEASDAVAQYLEHFSNQLAEGVQPLLAASPSSFQRMVWQGLLQVMPGETCSYGALASALGRPRAVRAVASAVGANPFALILPCHRICRQDGGLGGYRWGKSLKALLLDVERQCKSNKHPESNASGW